MSATDMLFDFVVELSPGVVGYTVDNGEQGLYVPLIESTDPGQGNVGRYLDTLPRDRRVVVPNVINVKLAGMLERRGFVVEDEWAEDFGEWVPCHVRVPA